jgi:hypothetical protein
VTEDQPRTGPARDVPPPRPVAVPGAEPRGNPFAGAGDVEEGGGLARAARAVADAVSGLLGGAGTGGGAAAGVLRDVVSAVAGARRAPSSGAGAGAGLGGRGVPGDSGRSPAALLGDVLAGAVPRLPIRDRNRLRQAHPGASDEEIGDALVARAARLTAGIGAATGGLSAAQWFAPPSLLALPIELGAETLLTAGVEVVLVGELHELYGHPAPGDARERAGGYLAAWSEQKAVDGTTGSLAAVLSTAGLRALRRRLGRLARSVGAAAPFLVGAALSGRGNRRATETLAERLRADLRRGRPPGGGRD